MDYSNSTVRIIVFYFRWLSKVSGGAIKTESVDRFGRGEKRTIRKRAGFFKSLASDEFLYTAGLFLRVKPGIILKSIGSYITMWNPLKKTQRRKNNGRQKE
ncbi:MAG: hypothetical protein ACYS71_08430 [Planctomycetota bacterium]